jgi:hypothetical protein
MKRVHPESNSDNFNPCFHPTIHHKKTCFVLPYSQTEPYSKISTFSQILQKQTASSKEVREFTLDGDFDNHLQFQKHITDYEYKSDNDFTKKLLKSLLFTLVVSEDTDNIINKYRYLNNILSNPFIPASTKARFFYRFSKAQRSYGALNRLVFIYKWRRSVPKIYADLCLEPISQGDRNVMAVLHNSQKYLFTIADMIRIVEISICNSPYFFTEPLPVKNPYTNIPFDKSHLYNMYFFIKNRMITIPPVFHAYFTSNFNLKHFRDTHGVLISNTYIKQYVKNSDKETLYSDIIYMFKTIPYRGKIIIDRDFPRDRLIEIMHPYLEIYYTAKISNDIHARNTAKTDLSRRLVAFSRYNKNFGRKFIKVDNDNKKSFEFSVDHIPYKKISAFDDYENSHLDIDDTAPNYTSSTVSNDSTVTNYHYLNAVLRSSETAPRVELVRNNTPNNVSLTEDDLLNALNAAYEPYDSSRNNQFGIIDQSTLFNFINHSEPNQNQSLQIDIPHDLDAYYSYLELSYSDDEENEENYDP